MEQSFAALLRTHREAAGQSQKDLAGAAGIDQSYVARLESGTRQPPDRTLVIALAGALGLSTADRQRLLHAAGHATDWSLALPPDDPTMLAIAAFLTDPALSAAARADFRRTIDLLIRRWQRSHSDE